MDVQVVETGQDWTEKARRLRPRLEAAAPRIEAARELSSDVLDALHDAAMFRMLLPRTTGGAELPPARYVEALEAIAMADASTAWCIGQASGCSMAAAYLDRAPAEVVFGPAHATLAWGNGPKAKAVAVRDGWQVSGTWMFASGGRHAGWLGGHCPTFDASGAPRRHQDGTPVERTMLFPQSAAKMIDVWHVMGLRGTGSDSYAVENLFVPSEFSLARDNPAERREHGKLYRFSTTNMYASGFAAVALGIARSMLDDFVGLARVKTAWNAAGPMRDNAVVRSQVALCEVRLQAARGHLIRTLEDCWQSLDGADALTLDQRMQIRLASTYANRVAREVADVAYHEAGSTAVFDANPFERRFRDINSVSQQVQARHSHFETVGEHMLGGAPSLRFI